MTENHKAAVAFGLLPAEIMPPLRTMLEEKYAALLTPLTPDKRRLDEVEHEIVLWIYTAASDAGRMVV
jgi:hypothetical protein